MGIQNVNPGRQLFAGIQSVIKQQKESSLHPLAVLFGVFKGLRY
ncbi:hypothetical protein ADIAL_0190 [Alkalibacterium sp. AK22]|nr:hypothetical protein ADIAL_0190 [Alkalibacterium sp. AK22]